MRYLYYSSNVQPKTVRIVSNLLGADKTLSTEKEYNPNFYIEALYKMLKSGFIDKIEVVLDEEDMAYVKDKRNSNTGNSITGPVNLCEFKNGRINSRDKHIVYLDGGAVNRQKFSALRKDTKYKINNGPEQVMVDENTLRELTFGPKELEEKWRQGLDEDLIRLQKELDEFEKRK